MPQEALTIIRAGYPYNQITWPGPTAPLVPAAANLTNAAYDSGTSPYFALKQKPGIPFNGMFVVINIPGPVSSTGTPGTATLTPTVTFADLLNGPAVGYSHVLAPLNFSFTASVGTVTSLNSQAVAVGSGGVMAYWRLPETRHGFIRVQLATSVGGSVTAVNYGAVGIAVQDDVDTEANNTVDLG